MPIYVTGDTHGTLDLLKFKYLDIDFQEDDYILVLGDFAVCWDDNGNDAKVRDFWNQQKCKVLFLDGNHENFDLLGRYSVSEKFGGKVQEIDDKITHLMRGQVYEIDGKTIFTMGGACSHDCGKNLEAIINAHLDEFYTYDLAADFGKLPESKRYYNRVPGRSWWPQEIPSADEIAEGKANLAARGNSVDYVLTHTPSLRFIRTLRLEEMEYPWGVPLFDFLEWVEDNVHFNQWWFGHIHCDIERKGGTHRAFFYDFQSI